MFFCLVFAMPLYTSVYICLVVTCWERADLLALVCGVLLLNCYFPICILGQVWYLIISIPYLCTLTYFYYPFQGSIHSYTLVYFYCITLWFHISYCIALWVHISSFIVLYWHIVHGIDL